MRGFDWKLALAGALFGAAALAAGTAGADAAPRICRQLQAELAAVSTKGGGGPKLLAKYDDAIARQRQELEKARQRAGAAGCGFSLFGGSIAQCAALNAAQERMNRNLDALERKRARLAGGGSRRDRTRLQALLDANGCNKTTVEARAAEARQPEQSVRILGGSIEPVGQPAGAKSVSGSIIEWQAPSRAGPGEYRTMCVRTCDGYFFPMSNAASTGDFERDQKNCEASCPGTKMQLFYGRGLATDSAGMISTATGEPYTRLTTAYLYKQPHAPSAPICGCNAAGDFRIIAGNPPAAPLPRPDVQAPPAFVPVPAMRPDPAADPETLANIEGGLDLDTLHRLATKPASDAAPPEPAEERKVRVVGPTFLPDPKGAIDLQARAPKAIR